MDVKIIAFYLPQFHTFPENDEWWGNGFTEWRTVKNAIPYFEKHEQPRIPLNDNYYCLDDDGSTLRWQAEIAKKYGIYGFCFYHYWFNGKLLMEKPIKKLLERDDIDINYCICWANENWTRAWADKTQEILIEQHYGNKNDWKEHFYYFLKFFRDKRYIKINNKPMLIIYRPELMTEREEMFNEWDRLTKANGFEGLYLLYQQNNYNPNNDSAGKWFEAGIEYQPQCVMSLEKNKYGKIPYYIHSTVNYICDKTNIMWNEKIAFSYSYDQLWDDILNRFPQRDNMYPGAFVDWDNTPRHKKRGSFCTGVTPEKFEYYLRKQLQRTKDIYGKEYLFLFAWNEWGEGGYLEPDKKNGYKMLEAIKESYRHIDNRHGDQL